MTPAPRLRVTSVRYADPTESTRCAFAAGAGPDGSGDRPGTRVLVVGTPIAGYAVLVAGAGVLRLSALHVDPPVAGLGLEEMLFRAAVGLMLDAGQAHVGVTGEAAADPVVAALLATLPVPDPLADLPDPIAAVSVIPIHEGSAGLEVFVQYRVSTMDFAAGAVVYPGGRVDPGDRHTGADEEVPQDLLAEHAARWEATAYGRLGTRTDAARTLLATGVREVAEETGASIDPARLLPWDDWITPVGTSKRFDVRFFLYPVAGGEVSSFGHTTTEAHRSEWVAVADLSAHAEAGSLMLLPPTRTILDELAALGSIASAVAFRPPIGAVRHDIAASRPRR